MIHIDCRTEVAGAGLTGRGESLNEAPNAVRLGIHKRRARTTVLVRLADDSDRPVAGDRHALAEVTTTTLSVGKLARHTVRIRQGWRPGRD
jgi:hypothetical protein